MTVSVAGTGISAPVDGSGEFRMSGVPAGDVQLVFSDSVAVSTVSLSKVQANEVIDLQVAIGGGRATLQSEARRNNKDGDKGGNSKDGDNKGGDDKDGDEQGGNSQGKVVMCHRSDNGYHPIDVSVNAEPAHRAHGDARPGEPVPADPSKRFDSGCHTISSSPSPVDIEKFTNGQDADDAPGPTIAVGSTVSWTYVVTNNTTETFTSLTVTDDKGVAVACPKLLLSPGASMTCTGSGVAVAGQYRNVGTATATTPGHQYTDSDVSHYFGGPASVLTIRKLTNGQDVSQAPGPSIRVGSPVSWTYIVTNTGNVTFSSNTVIDDRGVDVACPKLLLAPGASMTCTGAGVAVAGQYRNVGTVVAAANGTVYTASDASYYLGVASGQ